MILKGSQRGSGRELAVHLMRVDDNEHVHIHELRGFIAEDLRGAFAEAEAISRATRARQYLFSLSLNPPSDASVSVKQFEQAIDRIEQRLGLGGQPRAIVFHEKEGRRHAHCVWSRIDAETMTARLHDRTRDDHRPGLTITGPQRRPAAGLVPPPQSIILVTSKR